MDMSNIKWGRVVLWIVLGLILFIAVPILSVVVRMVILGFQLGGNPPAEESIRFSTDTVYRVISLLSVVLAGFLGGRAPARKAEGSYVLNGLVVGIGLAIVILAFALFQSGSFSFWMPVYAVLAIAAGALGGWLGGRSAEAAEMYD
jgi:putative membrane protein (TIGR04086 family)